MRQGRHPRGGHDNRTVLVEARTHSPDRADQREARQPELPGPLASDARRAQPGPTEHSTSGGVTDVDANADNVGDDTDRQRDHLGVLCRPGQIAVSSHPDAGVISLRGCYRTVLIPSTRTVIRSIQVKRSSVGADLPKSK